MLLLVLLCCSACGLAQNISCQLATVCVASEDGTEVGCQTLNVALRIIHQLSDYPEAAKNCTAVHINLTSGTHVLRENLDFTDSVEETQIHGAPNGQPTIVSCINQAGIRFSERRPNRVFLSKIIFIHCERTRGIRGDTALYFTYASWRLDKVAVKNTHGYGLYADSCFEQLIQNCTFDTGHVKLSLTDVYSDYVVKIEDSTFTGAVHSYGVSVEAERTQEDDYRNLTLRNCKFSNNKIGALHIADVNSLEITRCSMSHNYGTALSISMPPLSSLIQVRISECQFTNNSVAEGSVVRIEQYHPQPLQQVYIPPHAIHDIVIEKSLLEENYGAYYICSALLVVNTDLTLNDVNIRDNNCTGISSSESTMNIQNHLNLTRNFGRFGGAMKLIAYPKFPPLNFTASSKVNIINNTAETYGGGVLSFETCNSYGRIFRSKCFFQLKDSSNSLIPVFLFSGNRATLGGDAVFGGCLSNCFITINKTRIVIDKNDPKNTFWDLVSSENIQSQSTFVEGQEKVVFCKNSSTRPQGDRVHSAVCNDSQTVNAFRGELFNVSLMVTDGFCVPSVKVLKAEINQNATSLKGPMILEARKYCHNFSYTITGGLGQNTTTIKFNFKEKVAINYPAAVLTVHLQDCPLGFMLNPKGRCDCNAAFEPHKIQCHSDTHTLEIPAQTWVGEIQGTVIVQKECQYCKTEGKQTIRDIARDSSKLCTAHRTGIMCGACSPGYSLQLGGHQCADCSNSTHKGVILVIAFLIIGVVLVLLLLRLNLTVSTGVINGLVFYSNIVYLNSNTLLPISRGENSSHLQNLVQLLYTFQAWMNLDFGIVTCFFNGYDTYVSTWMQFVFPLYIWLLILIIVLASRYSTRIAKLTTSNTVSVLATLLLLSYSKLIKTSLETFSSTRLFSLHGVPTALVWKQDANVFYLGKIHVWLFLMSLVMTVFYILPFTLLIVLGPKMLVNKWINKMKPFLDTFYGPYTRRYRYWPGILLLLRLVILCTFAFLSPNDGPFRLMTTSLMVIVLLVTWMVIGNSRKLHRKRRLNYLELFFHSNLGIFAVASIYTTQFTENKVRNQQALAVAMVGSALMVFCGILTYQVFCIACIRKAMPNLVGFIPTRIRDLAGRNKMPQNSPQEIQARESTTTTHSTVEMMPNNELREPLLTDS